MRKNAHRREPRIVRARNVCSVSFAVSTGQYLDDEFRKAFRMSRKSFYILLEHIGDLNHEDTSNRQCVVEPDVALACKVLLS